MGRHFENADRARRGEEETFVHGSQAGYPARARTLLTLRAGVALSPGDLFVWLCSSHPSEVRYNGRLAAKVLGSSRSSSSGRSVELK